MAKKTITGFDDELRASTKFYSDLKMLKGDLFFLCPEIVKNGAIVYRGEREKENNSEYGGVYTGMRVTNGHIVPCLINRYNLGRLNSTIFVKVQNEGGDVVETQNPCKEFSVTNALRTSYDTFAETDKNGNLKLLDKFAKNCAICVYSQNLPTHPSWADENKPEPQFDFIGLVWSDATWAINETKTKCELIVMLPDGTKIIENWNVLIDKYQNTLNAYRNMCQSNYQK